MSNDILTQIAELEAQIAEFPIGSIGQKQVSGKHITTVVSEKMESEKNDMSRRVKLQHFVNRSISEKHWRSS